VNKKTLVISMSVIIALFLVSSLITQANAHMEEEQSFSGRCAQNNSHEEGSMPFFSGADNFKRLGRYLNLSVEQRQKMHRIRFDLMKKTIDVQDDLGQKRLERRVLMKQDDINWKKADQITDEIAKARATLQKARMRQRPEIKKILTPEQLEMFDEMRGWKGRSRSANMHQQKGFGQGPGQGFGQGQGPGQGRGRGMGW